eukprot:TRINITY_DN2935_c0_g1_i2.p2 TRINITY_DN2935_c0_g1~~TRINITY_DN2935_c0_g1_i2.p2  ORF type:complete len:377 (+),score=165.23 TRINITY_DN2935_c0_g1_i2:70-1131(+)
MAARAAAALPRLAVYRSPVTCPFTNLAAEERLMRTLPQDLCVLIYWRNTECVVVGRNQNQWLECNVRQLRSQGVPLVRRRSGGGTVWHDLGNACFSIVTPRSLYDPKRSIAAVAAAAARLGVPLDAGPRHDLWWQEKKVTGSAFRLTQHAAYHHGTLLIDADLGRLRSMLRPRPHAVEHMRSKGVGSVRASCINLSQACPAADLSDAALLRELTAALRSEYGCQSVEEGDAHRLMASEETAAEAAALRSDDCVVGGTPSFTYRLSHAAEDGAGVELELKVERGAVVEVAECSLAAGATELPRTADAVAGALQGSCYDPEDILGALRAAAAVAEEEAAAGWAVGSVLRWAESVL